MVVTDLPAISDTCTWQEKARLPSTCTMQAPHNPAPQPNLVPVSLSPSRSTHNNGVSLGASVDAVLPLTVNVVTIAPSLRTHAVAALTAFSSRRVNCRMNLCPCATDVSISSGHTEVRGSPWDLAPCRRSGALDLALATRTRG